MQDSFHSESQAKPHLVHRSQQPGLALTSAPGGDNPPRSNVEIYQDSGTNTKMGTVEELFCGANKLLDSLLMEEENIDANFKTLKRFQDMATCQERRLQCALSFVQTLRKLDEMRMAISADLPRAFGWPQSGNETNKWECIDGATSLYNALTADQMKFLYWISAVDELFLKEGKPQDSSTLDDLSACAEVLHDFESDQGLIARQEIVKIVEVEGGRALVSGCAYATEGQVAKKFGLYHTLKSSIERQHRGSGASSRVCDSCRAKVQTSRERDFPLISQQVRTWIPLIYLQPLSEKKKLMEKALESRNFVLSNWENYLKECTQAVTNLLYATFRRWSEQKMDVDYATLNGDMKRSLKNFFKSLEGSLSSDWECEIHCELILQQLRLLQSDDGVADSAPRCDGGEEPSREEMTEQIGQFMLERRIIFRLLEKHQEMLQAFETIRQSPKESRLELPIQSEIPCGSKATHSGPAENSFDQLSGLTLELKNTEASCSPEQQAKSASLDSFARIDAGRPARHLKYAMSETGVLSPPPPFDKRSASPYQKKYSLLKKREAVATPEPGSQGIEKRYGSEPCILEATTSRRHQAHVLTHNGHDRSTDLSFKSPGKSSRLPGCSFGQGSKSLTRTSHPPRPMKKSPPAKLAVVHPVGGIDAGTEVGYVVIMRPNFRERITTVLDTRRRKRVSIHAAIERGIAGFDGGAEMGDAVEDQLSEAEQKQRFFVYDTARGVKLDFSQALKAGIIHYDSSATESIVFDEYAKSEWRGVKSIYHPLVYRVEQVRKVVERGGKLIREKHNWMPFHRAVETGCLDRRTAEYVVRIGDCGGEDVAEEALRLPFAKALAYGLVKVVPLRHCLIEKLPREKCIFA